MGLRVYMKSGNDYYIDVSEYGYKEIHELLLDAIDYKDLITINARGKSYFLSTKDIEYFELDLPTEQSEETQPIIGFSI